MASLEFYVILSHIYNVLGNQEAEEKLQRDRKSIFTTKNDDNKIPDA